jgi:hypothetical protein
MPAGEGDGPLGRFELVLGANGSSPGIQTSFRHSPAGWRPCRPADLPALDLGGSGVPVVRPVLSLVLGLQLPIASRDEELADAAWAAGETARWRPTLTAALAAPGYDCTGL